MFAGIIRTKAIGMSGLHDTAGFNTISSNLTDVLSRQTSCITGFYEDRVGMGNTFTSQFQEVVFVDVLSDQRDVIDESGFGR